MVLKRSLVPEENKDDIDEVIKEIGSEYTKNIIFVNSMDEVLKYALEKDPLKNRVKKNNKKKRIIKLKVQKNQKNNL